MNNADRLNRLQDEVTRFRNVVCAYETTDAIRYPDNFQKLGIDIVRKAEGIACSARNIVTTFPSVNKETVMQIAVEAQGIEVKEQEDGYEIVMPGLMPKRSYRYNAVYLLDPLSYAIEQFCKSHVVNRMKEATIWYQYVYAEDTQPRNIRDYDNLEAKQVLDVINTFFLLDDGGDFCELHYSTKRGKQNCTRIIINRNIGLIEGFKA